MSVPTLSNKPENVDLLVLPHGEEKVKCQISDKGDCNIFTIKLEDHTIGNLIKQSLCQDPKVTFAAYRQPHPLQNVIEITIRPKGYAGVKLLSDNVHTILNQVSTLRETFVNKVQKYKEKNACHGNR
ncbi:DNA-directed RNA polymerase II, putative [Plasmodium berghei]|uniref:Probable DNA-directed RNA polymerase II subunit RPB11 n=2 Tax=Plasmodium berghei TaxID=5821 RepID=RPB11_PLABA|nr:DNA-directed RNA polymerase II subunit RPB11, putative [Plasmodium berghei ANKA]Q4YZZ7.1 RecName: Full=Probable DNA-directed RNA polymerase II subunit RPB11; Short=RNA polymerase II subunit B11; AltName: Full=DNA-directed RNA polymerase II subunit J [Plasmodium berghei ANKA]CXJ10411.1 DNA-directed RNA polymerase II, putative [Plasmodium berghei]SCM25955.1 DNA-directed RNA polymerase II, putative [Plasmodium berghei]SCN28200.1 DNA-directed RNA polymerase II, putative [Plasmodium berghei]SCO6|eukprot:XP_034423856.1 DNA-directed RNA polymerase II subunit RPB11, putative [Plasmodium berghei ANKA]